MARSVMRYATPLRYPGGKASFYPLIKDIIETNSLTGCNYYEPFAGGAGAAFMLLRNRLVSKIHLNDADPRIYALWCAIFEHNKKFAESIRNARLTICEWHKQHDICTNLKGHSQFAVAFATFFMNRCNRSGIVLGARPIGGMKQRGPFLMDARFNRESLALRVESLALFKDSVYLHNSDALLFLKHQLPRGSARKKAFVYVDPPYYKNGQRLYLNYYTFDDHKMLSVYMKRQRTLPWLMSYDNEPTISELYGRLARRNVNVRYSMQSPRLAKELLIAPDMLQLL